MGKRTFASNTFASHTFASGTWTGVGTGVVGIYVTERPDSHAVAVGRLEGYRPAARTLDYYRPQQELRDVRH